jgi:uncharacterized protein YciI
MLFAIAGYLKPGADARLIEFHDEFNQHLSQPYRNLVAAGLLRDRTGRRSGYLGFIEADSFDQAERFLHQSPYYKEGLYDRAEVFEYAGEIGEIK